MKNFFFLVLGLIIILGSIFIFFERKLTGENRYKIIKIIDTNISVEIADRPGMREKGLSGRRELLEGTGMLFIFDSPSQYGFWMKDMNFPIDILWVDEKLQIVDIDKLVSPETFPQVLHPDQDIKYVLELPAGAVDKYQIATGTVIQF